MRGLISPAHILCRSEQFRPGAVAHQAERVGLECRNIAQIDISRQGRREGHRAAERVPDQVHGAAPGTGNNLFNHTDLVGDIVIGSAARFSRIAVATERGGDHPIPRRQQFHDRPPRGRRAERSRHKDDDRAVTGLLVIHLCLLNHVRFPYPDSTKQANKPAEQYPPNPDSKVGHHLLNPF